MSDKTDPFIEAMRKLADDYQWVCRQWESLYRAEKERAEKLEKLLKESGK